MLQERAQGCDVRVLTSASSRLASSEETSCCACAGGQGPGSDQEALCEQPGLRCSGGSTGSSGGCASQCTQALQPLRGMHEQLGESCRPDACWCSQSINDIHKHLPECCCVASCSWCTYRAEAEVSKLCCTSQTGPSWSLTFILFWLWHACAPRHMCLPCGRDLLTGLPPRCRAVSAAA